MLLPSLYQYKDILSEKGDWKITLQNNEISLLKYKNLFTFKDSWKMFRAPLKIFAKSMVQMDKGSLGEAPPTKQQLIETFQNPQLSIPFIDYLKNDCIILKKSLDKARV